MGQGQQAVVAAVRAGKGALAVAEELAAEQLLVERSAILDDQRLVRAPALGVQGRRGHIFARARFPGQQDRHVRGRGLFDQEADLLHGLGVADELGHGLVLGVVAQQFVFALQSHALVGLLDDLFHAVQGKWLGDVVVGPVLHGFHGVVHVGVACDEDDGHVGYGLQEPAHQFQAIGVGQADVEDDDVVVVFAQLFEGLGRAARGVDGPSRGRQFLGEELADVGFVIHDQDFDGIEDAH